MPRQISAPEPQMANLAPEQMKRGIARLEKLIVEIEAFDTSTIQKRFGPEVKALQASIEGRLHLCLGTAP